MTTPTRWARIRELFDAALEQPTDARVAWLEQAVGNERGLRDEVMSLLGALDHARATLEQPAAQSLGGLGVSDEAMLVGRRVGSYDVVRLIGYGGMGAVYEGVRADGDFRMRVAMKFLRPGMSSDTALRRFRYERQILASLNHKNIAALHDGGLTEDGQPYFVMEYVEGTPITTFCRESGLSVRERVGLFRQVCSAVQHAHQQLVVHRDLKPGNILVTSDGTVKLLDFGIAKLLREEEGPDQLPLTRGGMRAFTPEYASPEQVRGLLQTPAGDIFSLGVILFELLTGRRPVVTEGRLFAEIERDICTVPPPRPSAVVLPDIAESIGESLVKVKRQIAGDLDAIVLTALAKEPSLRYGTAGALAGDLRFFLDRHPVSARKAWLGYRIGKFVSRRRYEVVAALAAVAALVAGTIATARQARIATTEANKAAEVNSFLANMLAAADPGSLGKDVTVRQVLDQAAGDVRTRKLDPEVEAQIRHTIGQTYYGLGLYDSSQVHAKRAFELRRELYGMRDGRTAQSLSFLVAGAEARGAYVEAESLARVNVSQWREIKPIVPGEIATALDNLARQVETQGRFDEAQRYQLEAIDWRRKATDSAGRHDLTYSLNNLAVSYLYKGQHARAESLVREALDIERGFRGTQSPNYGELVKQLGAILDEQGRQRESDSLYKLSVDILRRALGRDHPNYLRAVFGYAQLRYVAGDPADALRVVQEVVDRIGTALSEGDQTAAGALQVQGLALDSLKRYAEGEVALRRSLELRRRFLPAGTWTIASSESVVAYHLGLVKRFEEAERMFLPAYQRLVETRGADAFATKRVAIRIAEMYGRWGKRGDSVAWAARGR